jgi:lipocalin
LDHRFESGLNNISATYTLRNDGGINVLNKGWNQKERHGSRLKAKPILDIILNQTVAKSDVKNVN